MAHGIIGDEWSRSCKFMRIGTVAAEWRTKRVAVRLDVRAQWAPACFLDVESAWTREVLAGHLGLNPGDEKLPRAMAHWGRTARADHGGRAFSGLRYYSRWAAWECWQLFEPLDVVEVSRHQILCEAPELRRAAGIHGIRVY
ncbi:hypothetical protein ACFY1L_29355 [Streptomyces sp. NPDC001663]|uniref:hypothetical protein n=1 Tax=Streptomyces sp. NPDC001663 TaxID=3364597 RepID=UPI00369B033A